jgi:bacterioferritin-associated ferredoxin
MAYVCLCNRVSERKIRRAIDSGAQCVESVAMTCGAGTTCFSCHPTIEDLLDEQSVAPPRLRRAS